MFFCSVEKLRCLFKKFSHHIFVMLTLLIYTFFGVIFKYKQCHIYIKIDAIN